MKLTTTVNRSASSRPTSTWLAASRPVSRAALSCGLAGVLSLGAAGAALASPSDSAGRGAAHGAEHEGHDAAKKPAKADPQHAADRNRGAGTKKTASPSQATTKSKSAKSSSGSHHAPATHGKGSAPAPSQAPRRGQDPRGNNGTIKIDGAAWDTRVDNEPHPGCTFRVTFFGFDEGQTADITVTGQAPTGGGVLLHETIPTSDDRAGGAAHDYDGATRVFTADDLGLDAVTPHPKQGYHLKVTVDSLQAPGGAKQKVLWLAPCAAQSPVVPPATQPETQPETGGSEEGGGPMVSDDHPDTWSEGSTSVEAPDLGGVPGAGSAQAAAAGAGSVFLRSPMESASLVSAESGRSPASAEASALPGQLAFTGAAGLELLALTGAAAAAAGAGLLVARRRAGAVAG
jgi:hypothetical protein